MFHLSINAEVTNHIISSPFNDYLLLTHFFYISYSLSKSELIVLKLIKINISNLSKNMMGKIFCHRPTQTYHGHFSPETFGTESVITLSREKPFHMVSRVGAKRRSRYQGRIAPFALPCLPR